MLCASGASNVGPAHHQAKAQPNEQELGASKSTSGPDGPGADVVDVIEVDVQGIDNESVQETGSKASGT